MVADPSFGILNLTAFKEKKEKRRQLENEKQIALPKIKFYDTVGDIKDTIPMNNVAKDVCDILEIANSRDAMSRLDDDEKGVSLIDTLGGPQQLGVIAVPTNRLNRQWSG